VDNIYTHFPELEKNSISEGRLGEECIRLEQILPRLTKYSMILMNESLSSTSHQECLFIAEEIMKYLRKVGARCVFATHIHELAENIPELNKEPALSDLVSMVAGVDENTEMEVLTDEGRKKYAGSKRTYLILPMPPQGKSFALDIARTYGISFDQLMNTRETKFGDNDDPAHI
jgi:DNA mismatch repair ATPase MutS